MFGTFFLLLMYEPMINQASSLSASSPKANDSELLGKIGSQKSDMSRLHMLIG